MTGERGRWQRPDRRDWAVAAVVTVVQLLGVRSGPPVPDPSALVGLLGLLLSLAQGIPLLWRRSRPLPVLVVVTAAFVVHALAVAPVPPYGAWAALAALASRRVPVAAALATTGVVAAILAGFLPGASTIEDAAVPAVVTVVVGVAAQLVRERRARATALRAGAAAEERLRIARDLHDVLGHSLSGIAVQSSTGRLALDSGRLEVARDALVAIEGASRDSLQEVRAVLGALRDAAGPGLDGIPALVTGAAYPGVTVGVRRTGDVDDVAPDVGRIAYRVVQEGLTNVGRHAGPCRATVTVRRDGDRLVVVVTDDGAAGTTADAPGSPGDGHGLVGMRERVEGAGGRLTAGPRPGGGWQVRAELPARGTGV